MDAPDKPSQFSALLKLASSTAFLQAVVLAFCVVFSVSVSPVSRWIVERLPVLGNMPCADAAIHALVAAIVVTALRPPDIL